MDIKDGRKKLAELERGILRQIQDFEGETKLSVRAINLSKVENLGGEKMVIVVEASADLTPDRT